MLVTNQFGTDRCGCRKPESGMLIDARNEFGADFRQSWMIGNNDADVSAGLAAGRCSIQLVRDVDLAEAARMIEEAAHEAAD